jgi:hypothetical protein
VFGLFGKKKGSIPKHGKRVADRRAQAPDRWESIQTLGRVATGELEAQGGTAQDAVAALLRRYTIVVDPSITDGEEREEVLRWVVSCGDMAVEPVCQALRQHPSASWPLRILGKLVDADRVTEEIIDVLETMDTEYERDPTKKLSLLSTLATRTHPGIVDAVLPFLDDVNETARFHAVAALLHQQEGTEPVAEALAEVFAEEESGRIKVKVCEGMGARGWALDVEASELPEGFRLDGSGVPQKAKAISIQGAAQAAMSVADLSEGTAASSGGGRTRRRRKKRRK